MQFGFSIRSKSRIRKEKKLSLKWKGPYIVLQKINDVLYKISKNSKHRGIEIHYNRFKPNTGANLPTWFKLARF